MSCSLTFWTQPQSLICDELIGWEAVVQLDHINVTGLQTSSFKTFVGSWVRHVVSHLDREKEADIGRCWREQLWDLFQARINRKHLTPGLDGRKCSCDLNRDTPVPNNVNKECFPNTLISGAEQALQHCRTPKSYRYLILKKRPSWCRHCICKQCKMSLGLFT